jgi:hypothetical protein
MDGSFRLGVWDADRSIVRLLRTTGKSGGDPAADDGNVSVRLTIEDTCGHLRPVFGERTLIADMRP